MAEDPRSQADTDDLPSAREAFEETERATEREVPYAVARAAALLSLVRPSNFPAREYALVISETRELLGAEALEPVGFGRESVVTALDSLGEAGTRAKQILFEERTRPREPDDEIGRASCRE